MTAPHRHAGNAPADDGAGSRPHDGPRTAHTGAGARPRTGPDGGPRGRENGRERERRIPFPTVDEISRHCLTDDEPETVHVEIHLPSRPEPARLRAAFAEAMSRHPRVLVRQAPARWWRPRYEWVLTDGPDTDPVAYPGGTLEEARRRALTDCPPLDTSPPFRAEVVEHPPGWVLLLTINHTALDGPSCLRVVATAAELYGGADNAPAPPPVRAAAPAPPGGQRPGRTGSPWARPARVAADTRHPGGPDGSGNGMLIADLPVPARPPREPGEPAAWTVNDQLLVATWLTLVRWNHAHRAPQRPVRITMPVDDRPRTAEMPLGNGTRLVEVTFGPLERTLHGPLTADGPPDPAAVARMLRATAAHTRALKSAERPQLGFSGDLLTAPVLPVGLRAAGIRALRRAAGPWASSTLLSNIGRVPYPLDFGDAGRAQAVWFSAPARMPRGLSVTTVSTGGRLQLALRWSRARLDDEAGARLGALFTESLTATSWPPPEPEHPTTSGHPTASGHLPESRRPAASGRPGTSERPDGTGQSDASEQPDAHEQPHAREQPDTPGRPGTSEQTSASARPDTPAEPSTPTPPDTHRKPAPADAPDAPDPTDAPEAADATDAPGTPGTPVTPGTDPDQGPTAHRERPRRAPQRGDGRLPDEPTKEERA